ncbi:hypothetical protein ACFV1N_05015 [Streptosporangium canum]|uniref:hypothetical protein n=1 Tax=Streptosporangium canum TaxID=324952 RepID=UPI00369CAA65
MNSSKAALVGSEGGHRHHPTIHTTGGTRPMDHQALAEHIAGNFGLDAITLKTRVDCERELGDFTPLDPTRLLTIYQELVKAAGDADDADLDVYVQHLLTVIRTDGEEALLPEDLAAAGDYRNALLTCAATVYTLQEEAKNTMARFIALTRQARALEGVAK